MILNSFNKKKYFIKNFKYYKYLLIFFLFFYTNHVCYSNILKKKSCINNIIYFGLKNIKLQDLGIPSYINMKNCISLKKISNIMHMLLITNKINNINIFQYKNFIFINIKEKPIIDNIIIKGNKVINNDVLNFLLSKLKIKKGAILDNSSLFFFKKNIEIFFLKSSMFSSFVKIKIIKKKDNKVTILIVLKEDGLSKIHQINFIGNKN
ncbi:hypothetical protein, partial [Enterobacteriaceae endosymbiont of Donacia bicoloricornis]|uniref:hypothetical protein n=1 Tax=Enterobacteriaceae endosymbiont of Donacia bicoloricornis TaxID=2675772 RepID=UPI001456E9BB